MTTQEQAATVFGDALAKLASEAAKQANNGAVRTSAFYDRLTSKIAAATGKKNDGGGSRPNIRDRNPGEPPHR